jgi:transcriptional regulator of met regulon
MYYFKMSMFSSLNFVVLTVLTADEGLRHIEELSHVTNSIHEERFLVHCNNTYSIF